MGWGWWWCRSHKLRAASTLDVEQAARQWPGSKPEAGTVYWRGRLWCTRGGDVGGEAKATRGDNAARSSFSPSAGAPVPLRTSSPASGISPSSYGRRDPSACPE